MTVFAIICISLVFVGLIAFLIALGEQDENEKIFLIVSYVAIVLAILMFIIFIFISKDKVTEKEYKLSEINDSVYGIYNTVSSAAPAYNYEQISLCCDGNIMTFKGDVNIIYTDSNYHAYIKEHTHINSDEIYVYVPSCSIEFSTNISVK